MKYLGIDLGTANTYVYGLGNGTTPQPLTVPGMSDKAGSIATVVLYERGQPLLAGNIAEAEFYSQPQLQAQRRLASQFKPEIGIHDPEALEAATDFLRILATNLPEGTLTPETAITVGTPALAREDFRISLGQCFEKAGWPRPMFTRESDAALVSCLQAGVLHVDDLGRKCLILDFGGGTCDYTSVESLDVLQNGGDILYGGRLFDDLFYQAFCRENPQLATEGTDSPFAWHAHWLECRAQKEKFSDFLAANENGAISLRIVWHDAKGKSHEAFLHDYNRDRFMQDAENYSASPELCAMLEAYRQRGNLSAGARDLLGGRTVGLVSWMRAIFESVGARREIAKAILTGGSSRWFFVKELANELFSAASVTPSSRGYEDIAFGLAMFPVLVSSQKRASALLHEQLDAFTGTAVKKAGELVEKHAHRVADLCSERIVSRDIMPALEAAQKLAMTAAELEARFAANIQGDRELSTIAQENSEALRNEIQEQLNYAFRRWLKENGVPLAPRFDFPAHIIGQDFFNGISVKISRLDSLNIMAFTLQKILPLLAATATAGAIAHSGEPVSTVIGGSAAFGATWLLARVAPAFLEQRKLPAFILNERNRKKIAEKNREHIEKALLASFSELEAKLGLDIERRLKDSLEAMLASLTALNQVRTR